MPSRSRRVAGESSAWDAVEEAGLCEQLPLYPDPSDHYAYVRWAELPWPLVGAGYRVVCPADGCHHMEGVVFERFVPAFDAAEAHRVDGLTPDRW